MQESILRKLEALVERHQEVEQLLSQPDVIADQDKFRELNREYSQLQVTVTSLKNTPQHQMISKRWKRC